MLQINTNVMSLNAQRNANASSNVMSRTLQRLSSGLRVNSARDDAAGLAISERMTTRVRGLDQARRNMNDAVSMLQTAEGAMQEMTNLLQRARVLALQANNSTNGTTDRTSLQAEVNQVVAELERITQTASFNGQTLFSGGDGSGGGLNITLLEEKQQIIQNLRISWLEQSEDIIQEYFGLTGTGVELEIVLDDDIDGASAFVSGFANSDGTLFNLELHIDVNEFINSGLDLPNNNLDRLIAHEMVHAIMGVTTNVASMTPATGGIWFAEGTAEFIPGADDRLAAVLAGPADSSTVANRLAGISAGGWDGSQLDYATAYAATRYLHNQIIDTGTGSDGIRDMLTYLAADTSRTIDDYFASTQGTLGYADEDAFVADFGVNGANYIDNMDLADGAADVGGIGGQDADGGSRDTSLAGSIPDTPNFTTDPLESFVEVWPNLISLETNRTLAYQVGSEAGQTISISTRRLSAAALGVDSLNVVNAAEGAIQSIDDALAAIDTERGTLGAAMNRMELAIASVSTTSENISAARSRILDTDFALETLALTRNSILQQASNAIIAQANIQPQNVLRLLS